MSSFANHPFPPKEVLRREEAARSESLRLRIEILYRNQLRHIAHTVDRSFAALLIIQYIACVVAAIWISPVAWKGTQTSVHYHVFAAIVLGAIITSFPLAMTLMRPGRVATRHIVAVGQMLMSALLIHVTGGRIETHFHVFGSLAFLAFYRDPAVLVTASVIVGLDHLARGILWPQSVFGVVSSSSWRWLEHVGWVVFEDIFLIISISQSRQMVRRSLEARAELEMARDEALRASRAKDDFIAVLSHELRTPLTPSLLNLGELEADRALPAELRQRVQLIKRNVELEARLIDDLLDVTRIANGKIRLNIGAVNLHDCIDHALEVARPDLEEKDLYLQKLFDSRPAIVAGDAGRLRQIFFNLVSNAIKFTPKGRWIRISTTLGPESVQVRIEDSGRGIPPDVIPMLFQRFQQGGAEVTRKFGGLGLGLSICRSLVELHGGGISVISEGEDKGATFTLDFPIHETVAAPAVAQEQSASGPSSPGAARILLVEDHSDTRQTLARLLRRIGHEVITAENVSTALSEAERTSVELLLSDLGLPDGTGHDIMKALRSRQVRGIAISGFGTEQDIEKCLDSGFSTHLAKPVDFGKLRTAIDEVLQAPPGAKLIKPAATGAAI